MKEKPNKKPKQKLGKSKRQPKNLSGKVLKSSADEAKNVYKDRERNHLAKHEPQMKAHGKAASGLHSLLDGIIAQDVERNTELRTQRKTLDSEITAQHNVVGKCCGVLGIPYEPGVTTADDIYAVAEISEAEAADLAGLPTSTLAKVPGLDVVKVLAFIGCLILSTVGLGALVLRTQPKSLTNNPFSLAFALGLAFMMVGGAWAFVQVNWLRQGAAYAKDTNDAGTRKKMITLGVITLLACLVIAVIDAKAIIAMSASTALLNPDQAPSLLIAFIVGLALSASYLLGTSAMAFNAGYEAESVKRIDAAKRRNLEDNVSDRRQHIEIQQAIEALNEIKVKEMRREQLTKEIDASDKELLMKFEQISKAVSKTPDLSDEEKTDLRLLKKRFLFEKSKSDAHSQISNQAMEDDDAA